MAKDRCAVVVGRIFEHDPITARHGLCHSRLSKAISSPSWWVMHPRRFQSASPDGVGHDPLGTRRAAKPICRVHVSRCNRARHHIGDRRDGARAETQHGPTPTVTANNPAPHAGAERGWTDALDQGGPGNDTGTDAAGARCDWTEPSAADHIGVRPRAYASGTGRSGALSSPADGFCCCSILLQKSFGDRRRIVIPSR